MCHVFFCELMWKIFYSLVCQNKSLLLRALVGTSSECRGHCKCYMKVWETLMFAVHINLVALWRFICIQYVCGQLPEAFLFYELRICIIDKILIFHSFDMQVIINT